MGTLRDIITTELFSRLPQFVPGKPGYVMSRDRDEVWWFDGSMQEPDHLVVMYSEANRRFDMVPQTPYKKQIGDSMAVLVALSKGPHDFQYTGRNWQKRLARDLVDAIVALDLQPQGSNGGSAA